MVCQVLQITIVKNPVQLHMYSVTEKRFYSVYSALNESHTLNLLLKVAKKTKSDKNFNTTKILTAKTLIVGILVVVI